MSTAENKSRFIKKILGYKGKGDYILLIKLSQEQSITVGRLGIVHLSRGHYAYVGSARGGIKTRLNRHLKSQKKLHWHIDYLLQKAGINDIIICQSENRAECAIAQSLNGRFDYIPNFGSSDCKCHSHLFFSPEEMKDEIGAILSSKDIQSRLI